MSAMATSSSGATTVPVGFDGVARRTPAVRSFHAVGHEVGGELVVGGGADGHPDGHAAVQADEGAVARVARVGEHDLTAGVDRGGQRHEQRAGGARGDGDPLGRDVDAEAVGVVVG